MLILKGDEYASILNQCHIIIGLFSYITQAIKLFPPSSTETIKTLILGFSGMGTIN
jgi:hypothetical protein